MSSLNGQEQRQQRTKSCPKKYPMSTAGETSSETGSNYCNGRVRVFMVREWIALQYVYVVDRTVQERRNDGRVRRAFQAIFRLRTKQVPTTTTPGLDTNPRKTVHYNMVSKILPTLIVMPHFFLLLMNNFQSVLLPKESNLLWSTLTN